MMTSSRPRDTGESFSSRRGHGSQLSISDPSHHVTEAIGTLYGDSDDDSVHESRRDSRPLSFVASPQGGEQIQKLRLPQLHTGTLLAAQADDRTRSDERWKSANTLSDVMTPVHLAMLGGNNGQKKPQAFLATPPSENSSQPSEPFVPPLQSPPPLSPTMSLRDVQPDPQGSSQFPLTNIDNPNDIAQELSNLQALRRMSMDVGNSADPDLLPFQGLSLMAMPSIAPSGEDDEGDISRLLWVPAKVHPELAPDQFMNFLEKRVQSIKRRSGDSLLAAESQLRRGDGEGLRRKKSMLSRQFDGQSAGGDQGASGGYGGGVGAGLHLQGNASRGSSVRGTPELILNELVNDPGKAVQKLTLDTQRQIENSEKSSLDDDRPILPAPTTGLRRSTRTYRKGGSLRSGDRVPFSKRTGVGRQAHRQGDRDGDESVGLSPSSELDMPSGHSFQRAHTEPLSPENFSRPARSTIRRNQHLAQDGDEATTGATERLTASVSSDALLDMPRDSTSLLHGSAASPDVADKNISARGDPSAPTASAIAPPQQAKRFPQRSSSQSSAHPDLTQAKTSSDIQQQQLQQQPPPRSSKRPSFGRSNHQSPPTAAPSPVGASASQPLNDLAHHPSALPGSGSTRTDSLTFIPTLSAEDRKTDKKARDREDSESSKSTGWKWFKSDDRDRKKKEREREKEKEKEKEREKEDVGGKRPRSRPERTQLEKNHDGARLDVLQSSIDGSTQQKGRESLLLERESMDGKFSDDKKKDVGIRKISETKKEKDGFFGSIFGVSRRKESRDVGSAKGKPMVSLPEPPPQLLRPDIDYPYTRFPIVEERAIYRMAHIKLANPRRDLRSQVLLSNFMYSYLAKVQAMHPQLNVPTSPHQKRQEEERKRREQEQQQQQQQYLEQQMSMQQQQQLQGSTELYSFDYHRPAAQYDDAGEQHTSNGGSVDYIDDAQIFEHDHGGHQSSDAPRGASPQQHHPQKSQEHTNVYNSDEPDRATSGYYDFGHADDRQQRSDDMW